jgi:prevent-host-death family protein
MQSWPVHDAKARFSELLDACLNEGPQLITRRGAEAVVEVPVDEWRRRRSAARQSLDQLLLHSDTAVLDELPLLARGKARSRHVMPAT